MIGGQLASHSTGQDCGNEAETQAFKDGIGEGLHSMVVFMSRTRGGPCAAGTAKHIGGDCPGDQVVFEGHPGIDAATTHMTMVVSSGHCNTLRAGFLDDRFGGLCGDQ